MSAILYLTLEKEGYNCTILRYKIQDKVDIVSLSGKKRYLSHVVVKLENKIVDCFLPQILDIDEYELRLGKLNDGIVYSKTYLDYWAPHQLKSIIEKNNFGKEIKALAAELAAEL